MSRAHEFALDRETVRAGAIVEAKLAFDRASARTVDQDGHMHVAATNISKANVCPYFGREIPEFQALSLDPDRTYQLLRAPDELGKAAASFNGKPLLLTHKPQTADDHDPELRVGSINNVVFDAPYLKADLTILTREAIEAIETGAQRELSCGYRYRADMTPGKFEGEHYDGVMRDITGNHVALVKEGRAGPDVVVGDAKQEIKEMPKVVLKGKAAAARLAIMVGITPKLAADAKFDPTPLLAKVTQANFKASRPAIIKGIVAGSKDHLAKDASIDTDDLEKILDIVEAIAPDDDDPAYVADDDGDLKAFLKTKGLSNEEIAKVCAMKAPAAAADESEEEKKKKDEADKAAKDKQAKDAEAEKMKDTVTKPAMDAAIATAVRNATEAANKTQREIRDAEREVRLHVGDLAMAHDSAAAVYRTALTSLGEDAAEIADLPVNALKAILKRIPVPGAKPPSVRLAADSVAQKGFAERFPDAARIRTL